MRKAFAFRPYHLARLQVKFGGGSWAKTTISCRQTRQKATPTVGKMGDASEKLDFMRIPQARQGNAEKGSVLICQRSEIARKAVLARWAKAKKGR